ncbi:LTA synthase family protein [Clostridium aciditolerans]|uniref:LTA synthase family protein n=1 Tax=Clostridium aciditolerans TaxID=339861 RepID=A0A934HZY7_9CLOT|nr:LTA synthase family protein [Clostridium aciditolerans]MBI6872561.1 LTA synthase family protein [Clostridium aciditolerans]
MNINKLKNSALINICKENADIVMFFILIFIKIMFYAKQISPEYLYIGVTHPVFASVLVLVSFSVLFRYNKRIKYLYILDIVISLMLMADLMYYRYFKDVITVASLKNVKLLGGVSSSIGSLFSIKDLLYLADIVILIPFVKKYKNKENIKKRPLLSKFAVFSIMFIAGVTINAKSVYAVSKEQPTLLSSMSNRIYLTKLIGNLNFHAIDAYNYVSTKVKNSKSLSSQEQQEIKSFLENNNNSSGTYLKGVGEGKNLIVIQVEALQQFVINKKVNGQEITPNLNKWLNKSLYFDNYFYQVAGGNTSDAEFMSNNSLYPAQSGAAYYSYSGNQYDSLAKELKDKNYYTAALHGYNEGFWNRNVMYKSEKFDDFYGEHSFNVNETVGLGLSDKSFLEQSVDKLKSFQQPYYSFLITLSSHFPYDDVEGYGNFNVGEYENTLLGNYLKGIHYTDEQLGMFLDKLDKEGITQNSVIVLYGDHFGIPRDNVEELYKFENMSNVNDLQWFQYQKVPLIIHFPEDANKGVNHTYSGQMDLYPTLANLFNLPKQYMFGKDILNSDNGKVLFRNGSFTDGNIFYVSWTNTYYDIKSGKQIEETDELARMKEKYNKELQYSDDILNHNLIKVFEANNKK